MILSKLSNILDKITKVVNEGLGPLGVNDATWSGWLRDICIQLCATLILFIVIRCFLWKRVTAILEKRQEAIDKELDEAKAASSEAREAAREAQQKLEQAQQEIKEKLDKAEKDANLRRDEIILAAHEEAKKRIENAEKEIEQDVQKKNAEIHQQIVDIAMMAATKIVDHEIDQAKYLDLVNEIIEGANK